jgi:GTP cyclohydrolase II
MGGGCLAHQFETASCSFKSHYGLATLHVYAFGPHEEDNILCIEAAKSSGRAVGDASTFVRVQSACYTAEIFQSTDCDCHEQVHASLERSSAMAVWLSTWFVMVEEQGYSRRFADSHSETG